MSSETEREGAVWAAAPYERMTHRNAAMHDDLFAHLEIIPGEAFADLACGSGPMALRAAAAGAQVSAIDLAPELLEVARTDGERQGLDVEWALGDVEALPYADDSFDVVCSAQGVILAPDPARVVAELARVCRPTGRIGLQSWEPAGFVERYEAVLTPYLPEAAPSLGYANDWGREAFVREQLGGDFDLRFERGVVYPPEPTGEGVWQIYRECCGPMRWLVDSLEPDRAEALHREFVAFFESYREGDRLLAPREYLIILGTPRQAA